MIIQVVRQRVRAPALRRGNTHNSRLFSSCEKLLIDGFSLDAPGCNVSRNVASRVGVNLHRQPFHPLFTLSQKVVDYFHTEIDASYKLFDNLSPVVSTTQNFDSLRIPLDHVSRSRSDTYYLNDTTVLRTHTSSHQVDILSSRVTDKFLVSGDVYRRDEIDRSHYPVFHQMEGVKIFEPSELEGLSQSQQADKIQQDLKKVLEGLAAHLFGATTKMRWVDEYFPFTHPSFELEIFYQDEWMEVLGCGVIHPDILKYANRHGEQGWAFGLGLERLAMVLFEIPDIRLFWSQDERFLSQFRSGNIVPFQPYSKYPPCYKDISFWLPQDDSYHANDLNELVRDVGGDLVEQLQLIDNFTHPQTNRTSHCYRIAYRSMDRSLTNEEIDALQALVRERVVQDIMGTELR